MENLEMDNSKKRAPRNRTITLNRDEISMYQSRLLALDRQVSIDEIVNTTINQDFLEAVKFLPLGFVDLLFLDPPYNLTKSFNGKVFNKMDAQAYSEWMESWFHLLMPLLKADASVYICGDWMTSLSIYSVASRYLNIQNRITWEREKGRGAKRNWKNSSEDIWFCTKSKDYTFNVDAVKVKRKVLAPYRDETGKPKDWENKEEGKYRLTHPSNLWTDISVPFWSMPENTDHPTQKPEKLLAKLILSSSNAENVVFDPFLGSGTTSVTAKKLGRRYVGIEKDRTYACLAEKRLERANTDQSIQGYSDGVFWERNTLGDRKR